MVKKTNTTQVHYIHRISAAFVERLVGIFVLSSILIIAGLIFFQLQSSHLLDDKIKYNAYLVNAQGVSTETLINISGIEVGQVQSIDITPDNKIHVRFYVYKAFQRLLRSDSIGSLSKLSVIGNTSIIITAGSPKLTVLQENSTISIKEPVTADELIAKITPVITSLSNIVAKVADVIEVVDPKRLETTTQNLALIMRHLETISRHIAQGNGTAGKLIFDKDMEQSVANSINGVEKLVKNSNKTLIDTQQTIVHVEHVLKESEAQIKALSKIIEPTTKLLNNSNKLVTTLQPSAQIINHEAQTLPDLVNKMNSLLDTTNQTLQNAQGVWPLSTVIPESNKQTLIKGQPIDE